MLGTASRPKREVCHVHSEPLMLFNQGMKTMPLIALAAMLAGCGSLPQQPQIMWNKPGGATQAEFELARDQCIYEVTAATQQVDRSYRTGIGQEIDRNFRQRDLAIKCMRAKGFREQP
jgi:hypothetical protein